MTKREGSFIAPMKFARIDEMQKAVDDAGDRIFAIVLTPMPENLRSYRRIRGQIHNAMINSNEEDPAMHVIIKKCVDELDTLYEESWIPYRAYRDEHEEQLFAAQREELALRRKLLQAQGLPIGELIPLDPSDYC